MKCDNCIHARWNRTSNGRLHPNKEGRCTYQVPPLPPIPASMHWGCGVGGEPSTNGGYITRGKDLHRECPCFSNSSEQPVPSVLYADGVVVLPDHVRAEFVEKEFVYFVRSKEGGFRMVPSDKIDEELK